MILILISLKNRLKILILNLIILFHKTYSLFIFSLLFVEKSSFLNWWKFSPNTSPKTCNVCEVGLTSFFSILWIVLSDSPDLIDKSFCEYPSLNLNSLILNPIFIEAKLYHILYFLTTSKRNPSDKLITLSRHHTN